MEKRGLSLVEIEEVPEQSLILLAGPPGAGKSNLCQRMVLNSIVAERPIIFITTERTPSAILGLLQEGGLGEPASGALSFVDGFTETVGLTCTPRFDTICANCVDLNSISMAATRLQERIGQRGMLLALDSLTSPYLFSGAEVIKFMRLFLSKFAAEGNSVVALMDEGCGKEEDVGAMMSIADGVVKMEMEEDRQLLNIVKHPRARPTRIQVPIEPEPTFKSTWHFDPSVLRQFTHSMMGGDEALAFRREVGDFVSLPWPNLAHWSGMLWDPKRFPTMIYQLNKEDQEGSEELGLEELIQFMPWRMKLLWRALLSSQALGLLPRNFSKVRDMKRMSKVGVPYISGAQMERCGTIEYLDDVSKTDEHYFRVYESSDCWGFENVGSPMASHLPPGIAGQLKCFENDERDWNAIEIKCVGLGDPYCEFKVAPGEIDELRNSLEKDSSVIEKVHERLMDRLMAFLLKGKPLVQRPRLGSDVHLHVAMHAMGFAHVAGNRYTMAQRMGGARSGKEVGMRLIEAGIASDEAIDRAINFMNHAKVGKVTLGETIRIRENCESIRSKLFTAIEGPSCFFTTGFLNGLFSAVKNQHVREIRCIAAGDAHCEWEIIS